MVEFVHLPMYVLAQQDGLVQIAKQVCVYFYILLYSMVLASLVTTKVSV